MIYALITSPGLLLLASWDIAYHNGIYVSAFARGMVYILRSTGLA
jgi:hypothetical protein